MIVARYRLPALLCALLLAGCALLIHPVAEMGMNDDFSYIRSVELLLQTGHVHYVGWAAAMLGWQLYLGELFAKLFGFSFTVVRASILPLAMATAWLLQRSFVRAGLNEWNATLGTLTVTLSPLFLALTFSFMTDIPGLLCLVLCFYLCLRALEDASDGACAGWIAAAALSNALDGTVRQSAWLGVALMVPCACWLLRRRRLPVAVGVVSCAVSAAWILGCLRWFNLQPYVQQYAAVVRETHRDGPAILVLNLVRTGLGLSLFSLPVLIAFVWGVPRQRVLAAAGAIAVLFCVARVLTHQWVRLLAPYLLDAVTIYGPVANVVRHGDRPVILGLGAQLAVSLTMFTALICVWLRSRSKDWPGKMTTQPAEAKYTEAKYTEAKYTEAKYTVDAMTLAVLAGPMLVVYFALILQRGFLYDRYLLVPLPFVILAALLFFQRTVRVRLPAISLAVLGVFAFYGIAATHDLFAMYRAFVVATDEVEAAGVPRDAIDGGFEFNGWTQVTEAPSLNSPELQTAANGYVPRPELEAATGCKPQSPALMPVVRPKFSISFDSFACGGPTKFAPVEYRPWLWGHSVQVFVVHMAQ